MADSQMHLFITLFITLFYGFLTSPTGGRQFVVGGKDGWCLNPSEKYGTWAERLRFQVNDTLLFKYDKGSDSVLVVNETDYGQCNGGSPAAKLDGGDSVFEFDRSGPFFFISGDKSRCDGGEKLVVVVLAVRGGNYSPSPFADSPAPASSGAPGSGNDPSTNSSGEAAPPAEGKSFAAARWSLSVVVVSTVSVVISVCLGGGFY